MKVNLNSLLIGVSSIERSKPFYENVFEVKFDEVRPPFSCFSMNGIEFDIEENSPERSSDWLQKHLGTPKPISFKVENIDDFLSLVLKNNGTVIKEPVVKPWGWREASFADLDGNIFIVEQEV